MVIFIIDLYYNVCRNRLCEGTDEGKKKQLFNRKVFVCTHVVIGALRGVGTYDF